MGLGKEDRPFPAGCCRAGCLRAGLGLLWGAEGASVKKKKKEKKKGGKTYVSFFNFLLTFCLLQVFPFLPRKCLLGKHTLSQCICFLRWIFAVLKGKWFAARTDASTWDVPRSETAGREAETGAQGQRLTRPGIQVPHAPSFTSSHGIS